METGVLVPARTVSVSGVDGSDAAAESAALTYLEEHGHRIDGELARTVVIGPAEHTDALVIDTAGNLAYPDQELPDADPGRVRRAVDRQVRLLERLDSGRPDGTTRTRNSGDAGDTGNTGDTKERAATAGYGGAGVQRGHRARQRSRQLDFSAKPLPGRRVALQ